MRVITKNGKPVAKITRQTADQPPDRERRTAFAMLRKSLRARPPTGYRVGKIAEDDKYGDEGIDPNRSS
jgi:antitoxin (DNA-binding transcriptional repressor) of toxin-antitoxin stability system